MKSLMHRFILIALLSGLFYTILCLLLLNPRRVTKVSAQGPDPEEQLTSFTEWKARQPPPKPLWVRPIYRSKTRDANALTGSTVLMLVNPAIYPGISDAVEQWLTDIEGEGWTVILQEATFPDPAALRTHLAGVSGLDGLILAGDFPVAWYEIDNDDGHKEFPFDVYYMDLNGIWGDADADGILDSHSSDVAPEIWVGRLTASPLTYGGSEVDLLNNYFAKNHAYRTGDLKLPQRGLVYVDDPWSPANGLSQSFEQVYPEVIVVNDPDTTRATDYARHLADYYAWVYVLAHSTVKSHNFTYHVDGVAYGESIASLDIYYLDPHAFFYNLFACTAGRFIENDYLAGWYTFGDTYGLAVIASTKGGGMVRGYDLFHGPLGQGKPLGQAYLDWFAVEGIADIGWHYGLTIIGDPTLTAITAEPTFNPPTGLQISGPAGGIIHTNHIFTATTTPATTTTPIRYSWSATSLISASHNNQHSDAVSLNWWNNPGPKLITVSARNPAGIVTTTYPLTVETPHIVGPPGPLSATLRAGTIVTRSFTLTNVGAVPLNLVLTETGQSLSTGSEPDPFGYSFKDNTEPDGPTLQWIEIAPPAGGSGTWVDLPTVWQGGHAWPISLPFPFNFYGESYTDLAVDSRGTLNFEDRSIGRQNLPLPSPRTLGVETFIAHLWDFLVINPGAVYSQAQDSMFIIEYYQVSRYGGAGHGTWQIILFETGNILFQYQDVDFEYYWGNNGRSATVGIQGNAISGLQYSYDTTALSDGLSICFAYPGNLPDCSPYGDVTWLSTIPTSATIPPDSGYAIDVTFDAGAAEAATPGQYQTNLVVVSNDVDENLVAIPVIMTVEPPIHSLVLAPTLATATGEPGTTITYTLQMTNTGTVSDLFELEAVNHLWPTSVPATAGPLEAGENALIIVRVEIPPTRSALSAIA